MPAVQQHSCRKAIKELKVKFFGITKDNSKFLKVTYERCETVYAYFMADYPFSVFGGAVEGRNPAGSLRKTTIKVTCKRFSNYKQEVRTLHV